MLVNENKNKTICTRRGQVPGHAAAEGYDDCISDLSKSSLETGESEGRSISALQLRNFAQHIDAAGDEMEWITKA